MPQRFIFFDRPWSDSEYAVDFWFQRNCSVMEVKGKPVSYVDGKVIPWDVAQEVGMSDRNIRRSVRKFEDTILNHADNPCEINDIDMGKFDMLEYDMKEGGYSIIREESLLTKDEIEELSHYTKDERHVKIGKLQRGNPDLSKNLQNGFRKYRLLFATKL